VKKKTNMSIKDKSDYIQILLFKSIL